MAPLPKKITWVMSDVRNIVSYLDPAVASSVFPNLGFICNGVCTWNTCRYTYCKGWFSYWCWTILDTFTVDRLLV